MDRSGPSYEEELVKRIQSGDAEAEEEFFQKYRKGVHYFLRRQLHNQNMVDDCFQDVFRIAIEKVRAGDLRDPRKLNAFMVSLARFVAIDHCRREGKHRSNSEIDEERHPVPAGSPFDKLFREERANFVRSVMNELKQKRDRDILYKRFILEEDKQDTCLAMDLTPKHYSRVLHRALKRLRELVEKKYPDLFQ